jgi:hypothetical protein
MGADAPIPPRMSVCRRPEGRPAAASGTFFIFYKTVIRPAVAREGP